jgi:hypothetical protein
MAKLPDVFIQPNVPASEIPAIEQETADEGEFDLTKKSNGDGTFDLTFTRKKSSGSASP